jgi:hypothetical protein
VTQKKKGHEDNTVDNEGEEDPVSPEVCNIAKKLQCLLIIIMKLIVCFVEGRSLNLKH